MSGISVPKLLAAMSIQRTALLATLVFLAPACRADEDIEWRHRVTNGVAALSANSLDAASRTAFYVARGFASDVIRPYAQTCGFSFAMKNLGSAVLNTRLAEWRATGRDGQSAGMRLPVEWDRKWAAAHVSEAARIAFRWAQFQAENTFQPGDWIMGMATLDTPLSGSFRLTARYHDEKGVHEIALDNLVCNRD